MRTDKRGIGESASSLISEAELVFTDYADDARAWAAETARLTGQPCAWLIGHSEGALIALTAVAGDDDGTVCGLVLLSGAGRPIGAVLREQLATAPEPFLSQATTILSELEAGRAVDEIPPQLAALFRPSVQPYLLSLLDAQVLAAAQPEARLVIWEGVNHLLKVAPADRTANAATYANPNLPLAPGVVDDIAGFIFQPR